MASKIQVSHFVKLIDTVQADMTRWGDALDARIELPNASHLRVVLDGHRAYWHSVAQAVPSSLELVLPDRDAAELTSMFGHFDRLRATSADPAMFVASARRATVLSFGAATTLNARWAGDGSLPGEPTVPAPKPF